jgi:hypothetical protein
MKKDSIVQFVCFDTNIDYNEFAGIMENYIRKKKNAKEEIAVMEAVKGRFRYVSRHIAQGGDFRFVFNRGRNPDALTTNTLRIVQAGGYNPVQIEYKPGGGPELVEIMVFVNKAQTDISVLKEGGLYKYLDIYEAYFESCMYSSILHFFTEASDAENLLARIKAQPLNSEMGIYRECLELVA